ncbi:malic enzyme [Rhodocollybia butyracea]|uniref:Malic enzyme n=1 Tax=Rhodocollybia butyracea TaxID=206335 RepID=A0A9P5PX98_9AGAR|nr:malic enzyme [Rhodocollybia butyracea]
MTIVLTPYWSDGVQKLKMAPQPPPKPKHGLAPPILEDDVHTLRCLAQFRSKVSPLEKYIYLSALKNENPDMFYKLCLENMAEITPIIYTPTVGEACQKWSQIYRRPEGMYISIKDKGKIGSVLKNWTRLDEARIAVVTDGSRILGLGDLGVNGMGISVGKLSLYVAGAGIRPHSTVPICLDFGTNTQKYLDDRYEEMIAFMDEFMHEMSIAFPKLLIQFEDFSTDHAFMWLEKYRNKYPLFNDDIQALALSYSPLTSHRILFFGAGSAGVGVAMQLMSFFTLQGLSEQEARERIWLVDSQGLIFDAHFSRKDYAGAPIKDLLDIIEYVKPTALLGLSTMSNAFHAGAIEAMAALNPALSSSPLEPVKLSECTFQDAVTHTNGQMLYPGQGNNMYIFPATSVTDTMVEASSMGLAESLTADERSVDLLYPRIERIREIGAFIAKEVIRAAQKAGVDRSTNLRSMSDTELLAFVNSKMWSPML